MELKDLILQGEHQQQDFKYKISNVSKIAHSVSAFANTDGGRLLIGVRDNGAIAGVNSDEEIYMIDAAAQTFCKPAVDCKMEPVHSEGKMVLIATIPPVSDRPVMAREEDGKYIAYVRVNDENIVASPVHLAMWKGVFQPRTFTEAELSALKIFGQEPISLNKFSRRSHLPRREAVQLVADFVRCELVDMLLIDHQWVFCEHV